MHPSVPIPLVIDKSFVNGYSPQDFPSPFGVRRAKAALFQYVGRNKPLRAIERELVFPANTTAAYRWKKQLPLWNTYAKGVE